MKFSPVLPALSACAIAVLLSACGGEGDQEQTYGTVDQLPEAQRGLLPKMTIAEPALWGDEVPSVPEGYTVTAIANDLKIPLQTLVVPNGEIHRAEVTGGYVPAQILHDSRSG